MADDTSTTHQDEETDRPFALVVRDFLKRAVSGRLVLATCLLTGAMVWTQLSMIAAVELKVRGYCVGIAWALCGFVWFCVDFLCVALRSFACVCEV